MPLSPASVPRMTFRGSYGCWKIAVVPAVCDNDSQASGNTLQTQLTTQLSYASQIGRQTHEQSDERRRIK